MSKPRGNHKRRPRASVGPAGAQRSGPLHTVTINSLAAGGDGVGRLDDGKAVFVPYTAPGDRVMVRLTTNKASYARGEIVNVLDASPARVVPSCPVFTECGGCQWQHVARPAQLVAKRDFVVGALRHVAAASLIAEVIAATPAAGWRRRARVHARGGQVGFYAKGSHRLVDVGNCPQLDTRLWPALTQLRKTHHHGEVDLLVGVDGQVVTSHSEATVEVDHGIAIGAGDFAQANVTGNAALVKNVAQAIGDAMPAKARVLELFAGAGNFTQALAAAGHTVVASDITKPRHWPFAAEFVAADAHQFVAALVADGQRFDAVLLDPPRTGARGLLPVVAQLAPTVIVYVSCDMATLARDLAELLPAGYAVSAITPHDLMPHTAHVECVVTVVRSDAVADSSARPS